MLKLTFNAPASAELEIGQSSAFLEINDTDKPLKFRIRSSKISKYVFPLTPRSRGGHEALISSDIEGKLRRKFYNPYGFPFFKIDISEDKSWFHLKAYAGPAQYPPRTESYLRVWQAFEEKNHHANRTEILNLEAAIRLIRWSYKIKNNEKIVGQAEAEFASQVRALSLNLFEDLYDLKTIKVWTENLYK